MVSTRIVLDGSGGEGPVPNLEIVGNPPCLLSVCGIGLGDQIVAFITGETQFTFCVAERPSTGLAAKGQHGYVIIHVGYVVSQSNFHFVAEIAVLSTHGHAVFCHQDIFVAGHHLVEVGHLDECF